MYLFANTKQKQRRRAAPLEINANDETRMVSIWLTNAEQERPSVRQEIARISARNKARKYKTAVFLSGDRDLTDLTQSLLLHNRRKQAERSR